jgi:hypothetical protein
MVEENMKPSWLINVHDDGVKLAVVDDVVMAKAVDSLRPEGNLEVRPR